MGERLVSYCLGMYRRRGMFFCASLVWSMVKVLRSSTLCRRNLIKAFGTGQTTTATCFQKTNQRHTLKPALLFCRFAWSTNVDLFLHICSWEMDVCNTCNIELAPCNDGCHRSIWQMTRACPIVWKLSLRCTIRVTEYSWTFFLSFALHLISDSFQRKLFINLLHVPGVDYWNLLLIASSVYETKKDVQRQKDKLNDTERLCLYAYAVSNSVVFGGRL